MKLPDFSLLEMTKSVMSADTKPILLPHVF